RSLEEPRPDAGRRRGSGWSGGLGRRGRRRCAERTGDEHDPDQATEGRRRHDQTTVWVTVPEYEPAKGLVWGAS
ncbi:MAG: hypothetical protein QOI56_2136, partial [Actinomycetota bacterium]|nr:hypothetical protein [Actinomycetota bacterium]